MNDTEPDDKSIGEGIPFERLRRITGYLVGTIDRWNDGKLAELKDRVKHTEEQEDKDKEERGPK